MLLSLCKRSWREFLVSSLHPCSSSFQSRLCGHKYQHHHYHHHHQLASNALWNLCFLSVCAIHFVLYWNIIFLCISKCHMCNLPSCVLFLAHATGVRLLRSDTGVVSLTRDPSKHLERCCDLLIRVLLNSSSQQMTKNIFLLVRLVGVSVFVL